MKRSLFMIAAAAAVLGAQDIKLPLDEVADGWRDVLAVPDGAKGGAARFHRRTSRIDAGPCPVSSAEPFTIAVHLRTRDPGFSTPVMARDGDRVGLSFVLGREPGRVSFEAWSWQGVKLVSKRRVDDGRWHALLAAYDPESRFAGLWVDGTLEAWARLGEGASPDARLRLGNNIGADQPFAGDLDAFHLKRSCDHREVFAILGPAAGDAPARHLADVRNRMLDPERAPLFGARAGGPWDERTAGSWRERRSRVREQVRDALGLDPWPPRGLLRPGFHGELKDQGCVVQRVSWESWPGCRATGWLWLPDPKPPGRLPAVLGPHGHWHEGAMHPVVQARARRFAQAGYVSLLVDSVHVEDAAAGVSTIGVMTWNNLRALDWLAGREDVDPERIGVTGASGGAQQTMYLMCLDERPAAAAPVCMMSWFREIVADTEAHCGCNHPPRVAFITDEPEMCAVFAPRPAFFGSVTGDWTARFPKEGFPEIEAVYRSMNAGLAVVSRQLDAGHNYDRPFREMVYGFFDEHFGKPGIDHREPPAEPVPAAKLRALGPAAAAPDQDALAREHLGRRRRFQSLKEAAPGLPWDVGGSEVRLEPEGPEAAGWRSSAVFATIARSRVPLRLPALVRSCGGDGPWVVVASPEGKAAVALDPPAWLADAPQVLLVDAAWSGEWAPFAAAWRRNGLLLGCGEGYVAAHHLALAALACPGTAPVTLVAPGAMGVPALMAAELTGRIGTVIAPDLGPRFADDGNRLPSCPEILRFGDLPALVAAVRGPIRLVLGGVRGSSDYRAGRADVSLSITEPSPGAAAIAAALPRR